MPLRDLWLQYHTLAFIKHQAFGNWDSEKTMCDSWIVICSDLNMNSSNERLKDGPDKMYSFNNLFTLYLIRSDLQNSCFYPLDTT